MVAQQLKGAARPAYRLARAIVDRYRLKRAVSAARGPLRLVIGSAGIAEAGWIPTEIWQLNMLRAADWRRYVAEGQVDALLAEHVWEHLTEEQALLAARNCLTFLRPGGYLRVAVPDGLHPSPEYIEWVRPGGSGPGAHDHKVLYTYATFARVFERAGFAVELLEHYDETGAFVARGWRPEDGLIHRSCRFDHGRRAQPFSYTSIIVDARRPPLAERTPDASAS